MEEGPFPIIVVSNAQHDYANIRKPHVKNCKMGDYGLACFVTLILQQLIVTAQPQP